MDAERKAKLAGALTGATMTAANTMANTLMQSVIRGISEGVFDADAISREIEAHGKMARAREALQREKLIGVALEDAIKRREETQAEIDAAAELIKKLIISLATASLGL